MTNLERNAYLLRGEERGRAVLVEAYCEMQAKRLQQLSLLSEVGA